MKNEKQWTMDFTKDFRALVLNREIKEPLVFRGIHKNWEPVLWSLDSWAELFVQDGKESKLSCRIGLQNYENQEPQWESSTSRKTASFSELQNWSDNERWAYFDYKNIIHTFAKTHLNAFEWSKLGFPERTGEQGTVWIGTQGSHTPCHFDTYGCNLVSQVHGRKTWILFPPSDTTHLHPTRIPYEESSVYSQINFITPSADHLEDLAKCVPLKVVLEPGDVLFVPPKWWHFVKSENFTISVNTWIEMPEDREARVEEAIVRLLVGSVVSLATPDTVVDILNPNEEDLTDATEDQLEDMLQKSCEELLQARKLNPKHGDNFTLNGTDNNEADNHFGPQRKRSKLESSPFESFLTRYPDSGVEKLLSFTFQPSSTTFKEIHPMKSTGKKKFLQHFINAVGHPLILKQISEKFLQSVVNELP